MKPSRESQAMPLTSNTDDAAAVAADCFRAAGQMAGGPVRDALLAMGREYSARAHATARAASFRIELEQARRAAPASWLDGLLEFFMPVTQTRRASAPVVATPTARPIASTGARHRIAGSSATKRPPDQPTRAPTRARGSRLFRMHALTVPGV